MTSNTDVYAAMQTGKPYKTYKKVILGKVFLRVLDPFNDDAIGVHLVGNPNKNEEGCFFHVWNEKQDVFLQRMNKPHFKSGTLIEVKGGQPKEEDADKKGYKDYTDEDIVEIAKSKFFALKSLLKDSDSEAFIYRILTTAEELERPEKTLDEIRKRLSEVQAGDIPDADTD